MSRRELVRQSLARPYKVTLPMVVLVGLVPIYLFIGRPAPGRVLHIPAIALDQAIPLVPTWSLAYGTLYAFLIALPVFVVREDEHLRRTVRAYLAVWITAYACFVAYPTVAPRPVSVDGDGFGAWGLSLLYNMDPPYNCFPSLHVAHSFVSALTCLRIHRGVGIGALFAAALVALSTLFSKQHYVLDVVAGASIAVVSFAIFVGARAQPPVPDLERQAAPILAVGLLACACLGLAGYWIAYRLLEGSIPLAAFIQVTLSLHG